MDQKVEMQEESVQQTPVEEAPAEKAPVKEVSVQEVVEKKQKQRTMIKRVSGLLLVIFLVTYFASVMLNAQDFFRESAVKNATLELRDNTERVNALANAHYDNLEKVAQSLATLKTKAEIDAVMREYIGSEEFGDLRYYADAKSYSPYGAEVTEEIEDITILAAARKQGATHVYFDSVMEKDCIAFYMPVADTSYVDGVLSIVPARNLFPLDSLLTESAATISAALLAPDEKVLGNATSEAFGHTLGNNFQDFLGSFTDDKTQEYNINKAVQSAQDGVFPISSFGTNYCICVMPIAALNNNVMMVTISDQNTLIEAEMTFIRHITFVLVIAAAAFGISIIYSILYHRQAKKELSVATLTDAALECPNAEQFRRNAVEVVYSQQREYAVLACVIRRYRYVVDHLGDQKANELLRAIAKIFSTFCTTSETYGYAGEGKFLLLYRYHSEKNMKEKIRLLEAISNKAEPLRGTGISVKFNVGVYRTSLGHRRTVPEMIDCASIAAESIKNNISTPYVLYTDEVKSEIAKNEHLEAQMEDALHNGEFTLFLQPKYNVKYDHIDSAEALVRWRDPETGEFKLPAAFVSLFETNGFIVKIDHFLYLEVLKYISQAVAHGEKIVPISLNVSRVTALSPDFLEFYIGKKKEYKIGDNFITLELTESFAMDNYEKIREIVSALHDNGIRCSIDDFGAGYSSFNLLKQITFDELKIDRLFLERGFDTIRDDKIFTAIVQLAHSLGISVVQEGVETERMYQHVVQMGCEVIQGYLYSKPQSLEDFRKFLAGDTTLASAKTRSTRG